MADSSEPGPSTLDGDQDAQLQEAKDQFQQGIQAIRVDDLDQAVELFGLVLQTRCQVFGDVDIRCASTYFRYGAALFYKAQDEQDVFGASLQAAAADTAEAAEAEDEESEDEKENVDDKGKKPMREEDLPQAASTAQDEDADEQAGDRTDMELAWENLEVAKYIYEHDSGNKHTQELADVHSLLADIGMEQENFESALQDHRRALQLLDGILKADDRRLAELHYKASLTLQYLDQPEEALREIKTAVKLMEARVDSVKAAVSTSQQAAQTHADTPPTTSTSTAAGISTAAPQASAHPDRSAAGKESSSSVVGTSASAAAASRSAAAGQPSSADQPPEVGVSTATKAQDAATPSTSASAAPTPVSTATNATLPQLPMSAAPTSVSTATDAAVPQVPMSAVLSVDTRADARGPAGEGSAALQAEAARKEMADLESVLEDMYEKVEELQQIVKEQISTKNALKAAFSQIAGTLGGPSAGRGLGAGPATAPAAPVVDLGVVGRGTRRVTPMPMPAPSTSGFSTGQALKPAAHKRSFEDLMGGGGALTSSSSNINTFGFGQGSSSSAAFGPAKTAWPQSCVEPKKQKTGLAEKSLNGNASQPIAEDGGTAGAQMTKKAGPAGLPAFLQAAMVAETYGSSSASKQDQQ